MKISLLVAAQALGLTMVEAYVVPFSQGGNESLSTLSPKRQKKRSIGKRNDDPSDFSWIKRWAAVLNLQSPSCEVQDKFTCWQKDRSKAYA